MEIFNKSIRGLGKNDSLIIGIITSIKGEIVDDDFAKKAIEHHEVERNPWLPFVPLKALTTLINTYEKHDNIILTILPCPDTSWDEIKKWFPYDRKWIIPSAGEAFDEDKVKFYTSQGEAIIRYTENSNISGRELRNYLYSSDYDNFSKHIPKTIVDIYWKGERR